MNAETVLLNTIEKKEEYQNQFLELAKNELSATFPECDDILTEVAKLETFIDNIDCYRSLYSYSFHASQPLQQFAILWKINGNSQKSDIALAISFYIGSPRVSITAVKHLPEHEGGGTITYESVIPEPSFEIIGVDSCIPCIILPKEIENWITEEDTWDKASFTPRISKDRVNTVWIESFYDGIEEAFVRNKDKFLLAYNCAKAPLSGQKMFSLYEVKGIDRILYWMLRGVSFLASKFPIMFFKIRKEFGEMLILKILEGGNFYGYVADLKR